MLEVRSLAEPGVLEKGYLVLPEASWIRWGGKGGKHITSSFSISLSPLCAVHWLDSTKRQKAKARWSSSQSCISGAGKWERKRAYTGEEIGGWQAQETLQPFCCLFLYWLLCINHLLQSKTKPTIRVYFSPTLLQKRKLILRRSGSYKICMV